MGESRGIPSGTNCEMGGYFRHEPVPSKGESPGNRGESGESQERGMGGESRAALGGIPRGQGMGGESRAASSQNDRGMGGESRAQESQELGEWEAARESPPIPCALGIPLGIPLKAARDSSPIPLPWDSLGIPPKAARDSPPSLLFP